MFACLALAGCASSLPDIDPVDNQPQAARIELSVIGRYTMGYYDIGGSVPAAYDPPTQTLFVVTVDCGWIDSVDLRDPTEPKLKRRELALLFGGFPQSIALSNGILAVALSSPLKTLPGKVLFFDTDGNQIGNVVRAGVKPVQIRFTPDGRKAVVVNQGEANDSYEIDPKGTITLIDLGIDDPNCRGAACDIDPKGRQLDFDAFNNQKAALIRAGVRIYGPGASVAQDIEPEAVAIAPDGSRAWVSLQRNNAMAVIDLETEQIAEIFALEPKDHSTPGAGLDGSVA
ncbi:MAG: alkaline phosphatase, partial [Pseudomonadota bacterium]